MIGLFLLYYLVVGPKIDALLPAGKVNLPIPGQEDKETVGSGEQFDIGQWTYDLGKKIVRSPRTLFDSTIKSLKDGGIIK